MTILKKYIDSFLYENLFPLKEDEFMGAGFMDSSIDSAVRQKEPGKTLKDFDEIQKSGNEPSLTPKMAQNLIIQKDSKYQQYFNKYCPWKVYVIHGETALHKSIDFFWFEQFLQTQKIDISQVMREKWIFLNYKQSYRTSIPEIFGYHTPWMLFHRLFQSMMMFHDTIFSVRRENSKSTFVVDEVGYERVAKFAPGMKYVSTLHDNIDKHNRKETLKLFASMMKIGKSLRASQNDLKFRAQSDTDIFFELCVVAALYKNIILSGDFDKIIFPKQEYIAKTKSIGRVYDEYSEQLKQLLKEIAVNIWNIDYSAIPENSFLFANI